MTTRQTIGEIVEVIAAHPRAAPEEVPMSAVTFPATDSSSRGPATAILRGTLRAGYVVCVVTGAVFTSLGYLLAEGLRRACAARS